MQWAARFSEYKQRIHDIARFSKFLLPYWDKQGVLYICMVFSVLFGLLNPYLSQLTIDYALLGKDLYIFNLMLAVGVISYLFSIPIELIRKQAGFYLRINVSFALRSDFYRQVQMLSLRFAESRPIGEHLYRMGPDLEGVVSLIVDTIPSVVVFIMRLMLLLSICLWISWKLTLIVLAVSPIIYWHTYFFTSRMYSVNKTITEKSQDVSGRLQEAFAQIKLIKIFGKEQREFRRYMNDIVALIRLQVRQLRIMLWQGESGRLIKGTFTGGVAYFLGVQIIRGKMTLGEMTAVTLYLFQLLSAIKSVGDIYNDFVLKFIAMDRVLETLDAKIEVKEAVLPIRRWKKVGYIGVKNITFGYVKGYPILNNIRFEVKPGQVLGLTGQSGAGKTTLAHLLLRLYDPWKGKIISDGWNIRRLAIKELRKSLGFACHDPFLFKQTVRENIGYGNPHATESEIVQAAKIAHAHDFIMRLPKGYDTKLDSGGQILSQGQKQSVAIARAILADTKMLILDEALSSLSFEDEQTILMNLRQYRPHMSMIIISHRLNALKDADAIIIMKHGKIAAEGTYAELFKETDHKMCTKQNTSDGDSDIAFCRMDHDSGVYPLEC